MVVARVVATVVVAGVAVVVARLRTVVILGLDTVVLAAIVIGLGPVVVLVLVVILVGIVWPVGETRRATELRLFGDSYRALAAVDALATEAGAGPIVYSGARPAPPGWFFANTYRAFALPLVLTFGRPVLDLPADPFGPDPVVDPAGARAVLEEAGFRTGALVALRATGATGPAPSAPGARYVGTVDEISPTSRSSAVAFTISDKRELKEFNVKIRFDRSAYPELKNGMSAKVTIFKQIGRAHV